MAAATSGSTVQSQAAAMTDFSFSITSDVQQLLRIRIASVSTATASPPSPSPLFSKSGADVDDLALFAALQKRPSAEPFIEVSLTADHIQLCSPMRTQRKCFETHSWTWNEWITFPIKYKDLPESTLLTFTIWDVYGPRKAVPIGGTTFALFDDNCSMKKGKQKLFVWSGLEGDSSMSSFTPSSFSDMNEMDRLERLLRKHELGDIPHIDWMDKLVFREIDSIFNDERTQQTSTFLYIDLPKFDFPLVHHEKEYVLPPSITPLLPNTIHQYRRIYDPEISRGDNPVEAKHRKLARSHRNGPLDRDLKPNAKIRDELNKILQYPPTQALTPDSSNLLWKFRFYLTRDKKALTKFLKCVSWSDAVEARQAVDLMNGWLLGQGFENRAVRTFAVTQLRKADDDELGLYLLQLVQALRFESEGSESELALFLLFWYLTVECEDTVSGQMFAKIRDAFVAGLVTGGSERRGVVKRQVNFERYEIVKDTRPKKIETLRSIISDPKNNLLTFSAPMPLPLDAQIIKCTIFKSALLPLRLTFLCADGVSEYELIFKMGDDMRQDQLVVQLFMLMDRLLQKENLDLRLTRFKVWQRVLITVYNQRMVQFIPSVPLATILSEYGGSLTAYLKHFNGEENGTIPASVMDTYVKSCDRHLDNLLLTAAECNLILNLFALMVNANIPDIRVEPDKAVLKVQEKFRLDLNEEEAIQYFQGLINESIGAVFPQVMERLHGIAMMLRS
ncbi:phosphatidylinositol 3-kinase [Rhizoclosmatium globosum]|uniref:Phosphatidylinositol 3-kinase VPS34 n=1 Tax=Rhizoclosmatium globosum TaxID=329046 RepID=A0A1Y2CBI0_9FUNG|nr:phosphatidylinositol 3-kinase [Rhizoclosmatium globosum]|eukprot:ORY44400.1 phosphatidylinositol 3-kinase [Rhizoclosmatium globosum]